MGMSMRAYARHRGCSLAAVQKALAVGRIRKGQDGTIDPDEADREWGANTRRSSSPSERKRAEADSMSYATARRKRMLFEARLAKLEVEVREGKLVNRDEFAREVFARARQIRDRLMSVPRRISARVAAETDSAAVAVIVDESLREALGDMDGRR